MNRQRILQVTAFFPTLLAVIAIVSLIIQHGFYVSAETFEAARTATKLVLYGFLAQGILKLSLLPHRLAYLKKRWLEAAVLFLVFVHLFVPGAMETVMRSMFPWRPTPETVTGVYLILTQLFVILALLPTLLRYSKRFIRLNVQPPVLILLSFLLLVLAGTALLLLPRATVSGSLTTLDALFTSVSAVCVTGLTVVDTASYFTPTGHVIILVLIQIGGLGIMTLTTFFAYIMGGASRLKEYSTIQDLIGEENLGKIRQTIMMICVFTFLIEAAGAFLIFRSLRILSFVSLGERLFFSVFHSISAFCNAGFALKTNNFAEPFFRHNAGFLSTVMALIVLGGLGFPVLLNLWIKFTSWKKGTLRVLTLHSKLVLIVTGILIFVGTIGILLMEREEAFRDMTPGRQVLASLFQSVTTRTAGFNTVNIGSLTEPTLFLMILLMWIGASPGSTGGGVKTTTVALSILNIHSIATGRNRIELFRKRVSDASVTRAFCTFILSFFFMGTAIFLLLLSDKFALESVVFEVVSALSTVGLTMGITPNLTPAGKLVIASTMLVGRVGLLAVVMALTRMRKEVQYEYTSENVLVT